MAQRYVHYLNGRFYEVLAFTARLEKPPHETVVVYRCCATRAVWVRPYVEFIEIVRVDEKTKRPTRRFEPVPEMIRFKQN